MGLLDILGRVADKMASEEMQEKMVDGYMKGKVSDETFRKYNDSLSQYQNSKAKRDSKYGK